MPSLAPAGDYRGSYREDTTIFPTRNSRIALLIGIVLVACAPLALGRYELGLLIKPEHSTLPLLDTTELHAQAAVAFALSD